MIIGIGTDIVKIKRIKEFCNKGTFNSFCKRILNEDEMQELLQLKTTQVAFVSKRFAAKEALSKALGVGISKNCSFQDIQVIHNEKGKPEFIFFGKLEYLNDKKQYRCHLSISDEKKYALAFAIIEKL